MKDFILSLPPSLEYVQEASAASFADRNMTPMPLHERRWKKWICSSVRLPNESNAFADVMADLEGNAALEEEEEEDDDDPKGPE